MVTLGALKYKCQGHEDGQASGDQLPSLMAQDSQGSAWRSGYQEAGPRCTLSCQWS